MVLREDEAARKDKLVVSLVGIERKEYATALFSSILKNLDGEGRKIYDCEDFHWYKRVLTLDSRRFHGNTNKKS